ncbi:O-antigen ligase family protein [Miltoncostaea marina]|uniref:O-antigen ligase family protein n=1 Tax=Miltoncostaea marina TaxID=2843215 RepID=UPI001C3D5DAF|nr:O-antigen ligase family protein [Miltoncostaea marina]
MSGTVREIAAVAAALGVLGVLAPVHALRLERQRAASLAVLIAAWAMILCTLVPEDDWDDIGGRLASPAGAGAAAAGLLAAVVLVVVAVRVVLARPTAWFVLLAIALPIRVPVSVGSLEANLLVPLYAVIGIGVVAWVWGRARGRIATPAREGDPVLAIALGAFVAYLLVSTLWSADPEEAAVKAGFFYIPFVVLYALVVAWWDRARAIAALAVTTIAGGTVAALVALWQYAAQDIWWNPTLQQANVYSRFFRVNGIFYDPNILGRYLAIGIVVCLALAWVRRGRGEVAALVGAILVMTAGLSVTFSRSSTLMLMLAIVLLGVRAVGARRALGAGLAVLLVGGAGAIALSGNVRHAATDLDRLERVSEGRFDLIGGGLSIWRDEPVAGAGLGGFETRFEETLTPVEQRRVRVVISHNTPVTVLSEGGVVGFALFLGLLVAAGRATARGSRDEGDDGWARWTLAAILAGILVHSLLYAALFEDPFVWVAAGAAVALARARPPAAPEAGEPVTPTARIPVP